MLDRETVVRLNKELAGLTPSELLQLNSVSNLCAPATSWTFNGVNGPARKAMDARMWDVSLKMISDEKYIILHRTSVFLPSTQQWEFYQNTASVRASAALPFSEAYELAANLSGLVIVLGVTAKGFEIMYNERAAQRKETENEN
jgi:hypothetical protein